MGIVELLENIKDKDFTDEDGFSSKIELFNGLTDIEIINFKKTLPKNHLPKDIEKILRITRGFHLVYSEVKFDTVNQFGFEEVFPFSIELMEDGAGNSWILDIDDEGNWNEVFYVCHDPPVIVKQSSSLFEFVSQVINQAEHYDNSEISNITDKTVFNIWESNNNLSKLKDEFGNYYLADLTKEIGFAWGKLGSDVKLKRIGNQTKWKLYPAKKKQRKSFFSFFFKNKKK